MLEKVGDIWKSGAEYICITTNGVVKSNGELVMGAGIAKECKEKYPEIPKIWGGMVKECGNRVYMWDHWKLFSFPTKYDWKHPSDIELIKKSCEQLLLIVNRQHINSVALPKPGCGNGGLNWNDVKKVVGAMLDDRFIIYSKQ